MSEKFGKFAYSKTKLYFLGLLYLFIKYEYRNFATSNRYGIQLKSNYKSSIIKTKIIEWQKSHIRKITFAL